jgi:hypothetical protein
MGPLSVPRSARLPWAVRNPHGPQDVAGWYAPAQMTSLSSIRTTIKRTSSIPGQPVQIQQRRPGPGPGPGPGRIVM